MMFTNKVKKTGMAIVVICLAMSVSACSGILEKLTEKAEKKFRGESG